MKEAHLIYNSITEGYIIYNSRNKSENTRIDLGRYEDISKLLGELKKRFDVKRKTLLHLTKLPEDVFESVTRSLSETKIKTVKDKR
jgi:hypothetical protein